MTETVNSHSATQGMMRTLSLTTAAALMLVGYVCAQFVRWAWLVPLTVWGVAPFLFLDLSARRGWIHPGLAVSLSISGLAFSAWIYIDRLLVNVSSLNSNVVALLPVAQLGVVTLVLAVSMEWRRVRSRGDSEARSLGAA